MLSGPQSGASLPKNGVKGRALSPLTDAYLGRVAADKSHTCAKIPNKTLN